MGADVGGGGPRGQRAAPRAEGGGMSYTINVSGHRNFDTEDEARAFEASIMDKAKSFVGSLDGVSVAMMTGQHTGTTHLTGEQPAATEGT
jgi:hypothetical protein